MKVGTVETIPEPKEKRKRRTGLSGGSAPSNGGRNRGGGGGGGSGDNNPGKQDFQEIEHFQPNKSRILMWFLLAVVLMTFGGLMGAYIVISTNGVLEWKPFDLPFQVWISTALILASSVTYQIALKAIYADNQPKAKKWLIATTALGAAFISSQLLAWFELVRRGVYVQSNPYAGFFYILTAVHAVHVLGGIIALGSIVLKVWYPAAADDGLERRRTLVQVVGWYWHFMDGLWLAIVALLGFWK